MKTMRFVELSRVTNMRVRVCDRGERERGRERRRVSYIMPLNQFLSVFFLGRSLRDISGLTDVLIGGWGRGGEACLNVVNLVFCRSRLL